MPAPLLNFSLENAAQNYISGLMTTNGYTGINYYQGIPNNFSGVISYPCVITQCVSQKRSFPNVNLYQAMMNFDYISQIDAPNAFQNHISGATALSAVLYDTNSFITALNPPASGVDTRVQPDIYMYGIVENEEKPFIAGDGDRRVGQTFSLRFDCSN